MKNILLLSLLTVLAISACKPVSEFPEDLEGKKEMLSQLRSQSNNLKAKIDQLESEIEALEPVKLQLEKLVTAMNVEKNDFKRYIDIQGSVAASNTVMASSEMGGRIITMNLEEGDYVRAGSLVAKLDVESINKQITEIEKSLELAEDMYIRQESLWNQKIGSEIQYLQAKNNKERLEKSLETLRFQLTKALVYAPISGFAEMVFLKKGEFAGPGAPIVQIMNTNTVKIVADVPESLLGKVKKGEMVEIEFPALDESRKGRVTLIGRSIDPANRTFKVEAEM